MKPETPASVIRPTDDEARRLARTLLRGARFGALAVLEPVTGHPFSSRVLIGTDVDGIPIMLASTLSGHTRGVIADPRCSLLVGEPGKGDPLAWPRLTVLADAERVESDTESHSRIRARFLRRHPKSSLYADFQDFSFFRLVPKSANLNGGFGKAYGILGDDLFINSPAVCDIANLELQLLAEMNSIDTGIVASLMKHFFKEKTDDWRAVGLDADGVDLARKEHLKRFELDNSVTDASGLIALYSNILKDIR